MEDIVYQLKEFVKKRDWKQFHTPKNLAGSIAIEAAELLEHFKWTDKSFTDIKQVKNIKEEVADIMIYCLLFLDYMGADVKQVLTEKIKKNEEKYPA